MTPAVFLDRDGVLIELRWDELRGTRSPPVTSDAVALRRGVVDGLRRLRDAGYLLILASNQPDVATGANTAETLRTIHETFVSLLTQGDVELDDYHYCFHHPEGSHPQLGVACQCRKPLPGMILWAAAQHNVDLSKSWMVGDREKDIAAGNSAMCRTVMISAPPPRLAPSRPACPDRVVGGFAEAVEAILTG